MGHLLRYFPLFCWIIGSSVAFTIGTGLAGRSIAPRSSLARRPASLALQSHRTNYTSVLPTREDYSEFDQSLFLQALEERLSELHDLQETPAELSFMIPSDDFQVAMEVKEQQEGLSDLWKARLLLIGAAALYGTNFSLVKLLGDTMPVGVSSTLRFGLAALATLPWLVGDLGKEEGALTAAWLGFEVGLWNSIGYVSQAVGLETTPASESAFICSLAVVAVPMLDFAAGKRLLSRQWIGAILAVVGVAFLELGGDAAVESMTAGDLMSLVQPFAFGVGFWRMEKAMRRFPGQASRLTAAQLLAVFLASAAYGFWAIDLPTLQSFPWTEWLTNGPLLLSLFWTGLVTTGLTIYMETRAMETLSAAETTLIFSTEPLWGTAFAAVVMHEQLGLNAAVGAFFILAACTYSNLGLAGLSNLVKGMSVKDITRNPVSFRDLPVALQRQWTGFTSSAATRKIASSIRTMEDLSYTVDRAIANLIEKL
jgi:drug/metabolite transporter (DMT)-like permease